LGLTRRNTRRSGIVTLLSRRGVVLVHKLSGGRQNVGEPPRRVRRVQRGGGR
jgi:hypothetical protein